jgi:hypothetical protein
MSLMVVALVAGFAAGLLLGGRPRYLAGFRLRWVALLVVGAVCAFAGTRWGSGATGTVVMIGGYLLLLGFALRNIALAGMILVTCGLLANLTVIALDRGMPVRSVPAGTAYGVGHHAARPGDRLLDLSDQIRLAPLDTTVSPGDIVLALGVATLIAGLMRPPRRPATANI